MSTDPEVLYARIAELEAECERAARAAELAEDKLEGFVSAEKELSEHREKATLVGRHCDELKETIKRIDGEFAAECVEHERTRHELTRRDARNAELERVRDKANERIGDYETESRALNNTIASRDNALGDKSVELHVANTCIKELEGELINEQKCAADLLRSRDLARESGTAFAERGDEFKKERDLAEKQLKELARQNENLILNIGRLNRDAVDAEFKYHGEPDRAHPSADTHAFVITNLTDADFVPDDNRGWFLARTSGGFLIWARPKQTQTEEDDATPRLPEDCGDHRWDVGGRCQRFGCKVTR